MKVGLPSDSSAARSSSAERRISPDPAAIGFVLQLVRALHRYGESTQRLEDVVGAMSLRLGLTGAQFFSTPTSIMASFGAPARQRTFMLRVMPADVNLGKLAQVEEVSRDVAAGRQTVEQGSAALERIEGAPPAYGPLVITISAGAGSGAACYFLGGGGREILVSTALGLGVGVFAIAAERYVRISRVFEPLAAFLVSSMAVVLAHLVGPFSTPVATIAGLIVLLPGLSLTTALSELAMRHLASGTARLSGAFVTFLGIAFGVALGNRVASALLGQPPYAIPNVLPWWATLIALVVAPLSFAVLMRAQKRDALWIVLVGAIGFAGGRVGAATLGVELGAFAGALSVGLAASLYARLRRRPASVVLVPALLLLVPGSVGFRSVTSLMDQQPLEGIATAFSMLLTAISLAAGLLMAGVIAPEPRLHPPEGGTR